MTHDFTTIRPAIGLGGLKFGASQKEVRAFLGDPEEIEDNGIPEGWLNWEYPKFGVSVSFDKEYSLRLLSLSITNVDATLHGHRLIGLDRQPALRIATDCGLGAYKRAEDVLGWEAEFHEADLELRFDDDRLWLISWGVRIDENDVVHWPD